MTNPALTLVPPSDQAALSRTDPVSFAKIWRPKTSSDNPLYSHALKVAELRGFSVERTVKATSATVQVLAHGLDSDDWQELWRMQHAAAQRLLTLQDTWVGEWTKWFHYAGQVSGANSLFKLAERESNISAQFTQLLGQQFAEFVGLLENIEIDYNYWLQQKLDEIRQSGPTA